MHEYLWHEQERLTGPGIPLWFNGFSLERSIFYLLFYSIFAKFLHVRCNFLYIASDRMNWLCSLNCDFCTLKPIKQDLWYRYINLVKNVLQCHCQCVQRRNHVMILALLNCRKWQWYLYLRLCSLSWFCYDSTCNLPVKNYNEVVEIN